MWNDAPAGPSLWALTYRAVRRLCGQGFTPTEALALVALLRRVRTGEVGS